MRVFRAKGATLATCATIMNLRVVTFNVLAPSLRVCEPLNKLPWKDRQRDCCAAIHEIDADIVALQEWDFYTDGVYEWSSDEDGRTTNIYNNPGTYQATLKVTDNEGNTGTDSITITVSDAEEEGLLPSISIITSLILVGLLAIFRRK